jgi:VWFA-related protein
MRWHFAAVAVAIAAVSPYGLLAFQAAQANDRPITLDVVVTDAKAHPIQDLTADDFELVDSGEQRPVRSVRLQTGGNRVLAIFLDEYHVQPGDAATRARAALTHFVTTQLRDGDTIAVMKPLDPLNAILLTQDRSAVLQAISTFEGRKGDYAARSTFEENFISRSPRTAAVSRAQVVTAALQALATRMGERGTARKALILVSEGFSPALSPRGIAYAANRYGVAFHAIDPNREPSENESTLQFLADQTGGSASLNQADLEPALHQAVADLDRHYVISYQAAGYADGKFHSVQVRVTRPGAQARARAGYWATNPSVTFTHRPNTVALPFRPSHSSPYIRPWIGMSRGAHGQTSVAVAWEAGNAPPRNQRVTSVALKAMAADGRVLFQRRIGAGAATLATFDSAPGYIALEMVIQGSNGAALDTDYRTLSVPNLQVTRPTFGTPQVLRARTARTFAEISANADAIPAASRNFSRAERLVVRIPAYAKEDATPVVSATLLNRRGIPMRELQQLPAVLPPGVVQFDLPLSSLAPDEYRVDLVVANAQSPRDEARETLVFRVTD